VLTGLSTSIWFLGGINLSTISIITGLFAEEKQRGRIFGVVALMGPAGGILGGLTMGPIADRWGYSALFEIISIFLFFGPLGVVLLKDKTIAQTEQNGSAVNRLNSGVKQGFLLLIFAWSYPKLVDTPKNKL
jgi:MFS family permease